MKLIFSFLMVCLLLTTSAFASTQMREPEPFNTELSDVVVEKECIEISCVEFQKQADVFVFENQSNHESKDVVFTEDLYNAFIKRIDVDEINYINFKNLSSSYLPRKNCHKKILQPYSMPSLFF